jgi:hypothetical protein
LPPAGQTLKIKGSHIAGSAPSRPPHASRVCPDQRKEVNAVAQNAPARQPLPALVLPIRVLRESGRLELGTGEIFVGSYSPGDPRPRIVEWRVEGGLMPDEMILIFGRPLDWTGPKCTEDPTLTLVEDVLGGPVMLSRRNPVERSAEPVVPAGAAAGNRLGWCYGAVLLRGEDRPWYAQSLLTISRVRPADS